MKKGVSAKKTEARIDLAKEKGPPAIYMHASPKPGEIFTKNSLERVVMNWILFTCGCISEA